MGGGGWWQWVGFAMGWMFLFWRRVGWVCYGFVLVLEKSVLGLLWVWCFCFGEDTCTKRERKKERERNR